MPEVERRRGRAHDAEGTREAILNAAEEVFAEHGFDGARIDSIAAQAGYNKSLIFQYFGDKLRLYEAVVRQADDQISGLQRQLFGLLEEVVMDATAGKFKSFLKEGIGAYFDYLCEHPRFLRILLWELAEGWQTMGKIFSQKDIDDIQLFMPLVEKVRQAGLLRSDFDAMIQLTMALYLCEFYLGSVPMFKILQPEQELSTAEALAKARDFITEFIASGIVVDPTGSGG